MITEETQGEPVTKDIDSKEAKYICIVENSMNKAVNTMLQAQ